MNVLKISFSLWDEIATENVYTSFHVAEGVDARTAWCGTREIVYRTDVGPDEWATYNANYESTAILVASEEEAVARVIGIVPKKQRMIIDVFPSGFVEYITGAFDGSNVGDGTRMSMSSDGTSGNVTVEGTFLDKVGLIKGTALYKGFTRNDWVLMECFAPATPVVSNGGGTGNCNVVGGVIVPAAGDGAFDVDLSNAFIVPASGAGYWDWDSPDTGKGAIAPSALPGTAGWHLLAVEQILNRFINRAGAIGDGNIFYGVEVLEPKTLAPHWSHRLILHVDTTVPHTADIEIHMIMARSRTF